jgi:hypothetical protein
MALHLDVGGFGASAIWAGKIGSSLIPDDINRFRVMHGGELAPSSTLCFQNSNIYLPTVTCNSMKSVAFFSALTNCTTQNTEGHGLFMWRKNDSPRLRKLVATGDPVVYGTQTGVFTSVGSHLIPPALNALDEVVFIGSINTCSSGQCVSDQRTAPLTLAAGCRGASTGREAIVRAGGRGWRGGW